MSHNGEIVFVRYGFHVTDLFSGLDDYNRYDVEACAQKFKDLCQAALEQEYPDAKVVQVLFDTGASGALPSAMQTQVLRRKSPDTEIEDLFDNHLESYEISDPREIEFVEDLCNRIYRDYKWEVRRSWLTIEEAHKRFDVPVSTIRWACKEGLIEEAERVIGGWEFPLDAFVEIRKNNAFATCREVLSISVASDDTYAFECHSEEILCICAADFPAGIKAFLVVSGCFGIPLFSEDNSSLLISRHAATINLEFEHFSGERPWTHRPWRYDVYARAMVSLAEQYEFIESEWQESERLGETHIDSMRFKFAYDVSPLYTLRELVDQAASTLGGLVQETEIDLSGGPVWKDGYEKDEALFCRHVLAPLLRRMGFESVRYTHGRKEYGKDFTFSELTKFGDLRHYGLQAKAGNVSGEVNSEVDEILGQIRDAFEMPYHELGTRTPRYISNFIVAISGCFTENAQEKIREKMPKGIVGSVYFWDKEKILGLIAKYWTR